MPRPYLAGLHRLMYYRSLLADDLIGKIQVLTRMINDHGIADMIKVEHFYYQIASVLVNDRHLQMMPGDLWRNYILRLVIEDENLFSLSAEKYGSNLPATMKRMVRDDLKLIHELFSLDLHEISSDLGFQTPFYLTASDPGSGSITIHQEHYIRQAGTLYDCLETGDTEAFAPLLTGFYHRMGCGRLARYGAFSWDGSLEGIDHPDTSTFNSLVGYETQKQELRQNTEAFLTGHMANNVLLYGEKGTGKSTSIKALINSYGHQGLRMVEISKSRLKDLGKLIKELKTRGLHFIIFVDDLSFDDFEVDYKYIKASIEGSLEMRPENVLMYVTSNRRNLIRENFEDRLSRGEDVHISDTYQEKSSVADRFGLTISYYSPDKEEYLAIVEAIAQQSGINIPREELRRQAIEWGIRRSGWSGRVARQFINSLVEA